MSKTGFKRRDGVVVSNLSFLALAWRLETGFVEDIVEKSHVATGAEALSVTLSSNVSAPRTREIHFLKFELAWS